MNKYIHPLNQHQLNYPLPKQTKKSVESNSFKDVLSNYTNVKITKHAANRISERDIQIDQEKWNEIAGKMIEAKSKGVTDALVVLDDVALIVNTKENTVITALHQKETNQKIFTNINGTILL